MPLVLIMTWLYGVKTCDVGHMHYLGALKPNTRSCGAKQPKCFEEIHAPESLPEGSKRFDEAFEEEVLTPLFGHISFVNKDEVLQRQLCQEIVERLLCYDSQRVFKYVTLLLSNSLNFR